MIRILYIHHTFRAQSYNSLLYDFAKKADRTKFELFACCLREGGPYEKRLRDAGVQTRNFKMKSLVSLWTILRIARYIKQNKIDIVSTAVFPADVYGRIAAKIARAPIIVSTMHRFEDHKQEMIYGMLFWLDRLTMRLTTKLVAVSETVREYLIRWHKVNPEKVVTVYNGIDIEKYRRDGNRKAVKNELGLGSDCLTVGAVGRLVAVKGLEYFLEAAVKVVQESKIVRFLIVGGGPLENKLKKKAYDLGISDYIVYTGFRHDIPNLLAAMDVFVSASLSEGLGIAILEAMAAGKAVVGTTVGSNRETVINGETGILVPPRDPEALAKAIIELLDCPERRRTMGEKGRRRVIESFSIDKMVKRYEEFYGSLLK